MDEVTPEQGYALLKGKRVLVVEDDASISLCLEEELVDVGAEIIGCARTVSEALRIIEQAGGRDGIDVAVLDIDLDGHSALPVADVLARSGVPFAFSTGFGEADNTARHPTAPILHKPYNPRQLVYTIQALCNAPEEDSPR